MENQNGRNKTKKGGNGGIIGAVAAILLLNIAGTDSGGALMGVLLMVGLLVLVVYLIIKFMKKSGSSSADDFKKSFSNATAHISGNTARKREEAEVYDREYIPRREEAPKQQFYDAEDVFDNYQRDKEQRIAQLKVFLENGIIDKNEYQVLFNIYQEDTINYR